MKKRILSIFLAIVMAVELMPCFSLTAFALTATGNCGPEGAEDSVK